MADRPAQQAHGSAELARTNCLCPYDKINLRRFSLKMFSSISKMSIVHVLHPPPRSCQELHLSPGVIYVVNYWGQGVVPAENGEAAEGGLWGQGTAVSWEMQGAGWERAFN